MSGRVLITGATSGIGRQLALDYRRSGWQVWGCGRDGERLQALADEGITPCNSMHGTVPPWQRLPPACPGWIC